MKGSGFGVSGVGSRSLMHLGVSCWGLRESKHAGFCS